MSNSESPDSKDKENKGWGITVWIFIGLAVLFLAAGAYMAYRDWPGWSTSENWGDAGVRGDFWGGHLAAASGLAGTLILFAALLLQGNELRLQREELQESREIATQQAKALEKQTDELKAQNDNLKLQIGLTESRDEIQLILSIANEVQRLEHEFDSDPHRDVLNREGPATREGPKLKSLRRNQDRLVQFVVRRIVLQFEVNQSRTEENMQIFFAHLPERLHETGFAVMEATILECNPRPYEPSKDKPTDEWFQEMKLLISEPPVSK